MLLNRRQADACDDNDNDDDRIMPARKSIARRKQ